MYAKPRMKNLILRHQAVVVEPRIVAVVEVADMNIVTMSMVVVAALQMKAAVAARPSFRSKALEAAAATKDLLYSWV